MNRRPVGVHDGLDKPTVVVGVLCDTTQRVDRLLELTALVELKLGDQIIIQRGVVTHQNRLVQTPQHVVDRLRLTTRTILHFEHAAGVMVVGLAHHKPACRVPCGDTTPHSGYISCGVVLKR